MVWPPCVRELSQNFFPFAMDDRGPSAVGMLTTHSDITPGLPVV
jgi:hypothetical protein